LSTIDPVSGRPLTAGERALAASMFGDAICYGRVRVHRAKWWPLHPRNAIMAPDGDIWIHPRGPHWRDDFSAASLMMQGLFIHEMTHVWQAQRGGRWFLPLMRHPFCRYAVRVKAGRPFRRYGLEQQAELVRHAFLARRGQDGTGRAEVAVYDALLPFAGRRA
jgi:hypothetical protein